MKLYRIPRVSARVWRLLQAVPVFVALVLSLGAVAWAQGSQGHLPDGIPDLSNPQVGDGWKGYQVGTLDNDPDFPLIMFVNTSGNQPAAMMFGLDARNGKESFSMASDPVILIAVFADPHTITRLYYDEGFSGSGQPSGQFTQIANPDPESLPDLLGTIVKAQHHSPARQEVQAEEVH